MANHMGRCLWIALSAALLLNSVDAQRQTRQRKSQQGRQDELDVDGLASLPVLTSSGPNNATVTEFKCKSAGFFANEQDCALFYRCVDYFGTGEHFSLFHFQCAPGTIFDESISVCNHPEAVIPKPKCFKSAEEPVSGASNAAGASTGSEVPSIASAGEGTSSSSSAPDAGNLVSVTTEATTSGTTTCVCTTTPSPLVTTTAPSLPAVVELTTPAATAVPTTAIPTTAAPATSAPATSAPTTAAPSAASEGTTAPSIGVTDSETVANTEASSSTSSEATTLPSSTLAPSTEAPELATTITGAPSTSAALESSPSTESPDAPSTEPPTTTSGPASTTSFESSMSSSTVAPLAPPPPGVSPAGGSSEAFVLVCGDQAFHRHPLDCKLYYQCIWSGFAFTFNLYSCQGDTIYDEATGVCTSPDTTSPCELKSVPALPVVNVTALPGEETTSVSAATTTVATPQYTLAPGSLYDCPKPGHYPYQLDCIRFYRCFEITPGVLKGLLYRCPPGYGYSKVSERCEKEETLGTCDISVVRKGSFPVPMFPLEQSIMVPVKDFDEFFSNPNFFYFPRNSDRRALFN